MNTKPNLIASENLNTLHEQIKENYYQKVIFWNIPRNTSVENPTIVEKAYNLERQHMHCTK